MSDGLRADLRCMTYAEGAARLRPNEARPKRRGEVEIGEGEVTELRDVPRREAKETEGPEGATAKGARLAADADEWDLALLDQTRVLSANRDAAQALYLEHQTKAPPNGHAFKVERGERGQKILDDFRHYTDAAAETGALRVGTRAAFSVLDLADDEFCGLMGATEASGHGRRDGKSFKVDTGRLAAEDGALWDETRGTSRAMMLSEVDLDALPLMVTSVMNISGRLKSCEAKLRDKALESEAGPIREARDAAARRVELADSIGEAVGEIASFMPSLLKFREALDPRELPAGKASGGLSAILAPGARARLERLQRRLSALQQLAAAAEASAEDSKILETSQQLEERLINLSDGLARAGAKLSRRRRAVSEIGAGIDDTKRADGSLPSDHARFQPVAKRSARVETALATNRVAWTAVHQLQGRAEGAAKTIDDLMQSGCGSHKLFELRAKVTRNVPRELERRTAAIGDSLERRATILHASRSPRASEDS